VRLDQHTKVRMYHNVNEKCIRHRQVVQEAKAVKDEVIAQSKLKKSLNEENTNLSAIKDSPVKSNVSIDISPQEETTSQVPKSNGKDSDDGSSSVPSSDSSSSASSLGNFFPHI
jgi:hypothetical protein